jgi:hypothetical protein
MIPTPSDTPGTPEVTPKPAIEAQSPKPLPKEARDTFAWIELSFKSITMILAVIAALQASTAYRQEVQTRLFEQKIKVFDEALSAAGKLVVATPDTFENQLDTFGLTKHGQVIMVGDPQAYEAMVLVWNEAVDIYNNDSYSNRAKLEDAYENLATTLQRSLVTEGKGQQKWFGL